MPSVDLFDTFPFGPVDPFLVVKAKRQIYNEFPEIAAQFAKYDIEAIAHSVFAYYRLLSVQPLRNLQDLNGKKMGVLGRWFGKWVEPVGIVPVAMAVTGRYQALQSKLLDVDLLPVNMQYSYKLYEVAKYASSIEMGTWAREGLMINTKSMSKLDPKTQQIIRDVGIESENYMAQLIVNDLKKIEEQLKAQGVTFIQFPEEDTVRWANKISDVPADACVEKEQLGVSAWKMAQRWQEITTQLGFKWARKWAVKK